MTPLTWSKTNFLLKFCVKPFYNKTVTSIGQSEHSIRKFTLTATTALKKISVSTDDNVTTIEGVYIDTKDSHKLLDKLLDTDHADSTQRKLCPLCPEKLKVDVKYTDVLILSQFLRPDGNPLPKYVTGLCPKAQRKLKTLALQAHTAGLIPELRPDLPNGKVRTSSRSNYKWKKYNVYYEDPIQWKNH